MQRYDVLIIGGGIVGVATALQLGRRFPSLRLAVVEKESDLGAHQTGHNSGVLHSGIYYKPGTMRAKLGRIGKQAMEDFCTVERIPFDRCGKVIVAVTADEIPALERIHERGVANGVECERIGPERLKEIEPHVVGVQAIHVREAGIVDYRQVCLRMGQRIREHGGEIITGARVIGIEPRSEEVVLTTTRGELAAGHVINCTGLYSDRTTRLGGQKPEVQILPFRGEFYKLKPHAWDLCQGLIYPVPDTRFPFLGVHFTRVIEGGVECGPNAVLALAREGYSWSKINLRDLAEALTYRGFLRLAFRYWRTGMSEVWRSISKRAFVRALQRMVPELKSEDIEPAPAGVRAQAVTREGQLLDDFLIQHNGRITNVGNAPSPAATTSLKIGETIVEDLAATLKEIAPVVG